MTAESVLREYFGYSSFREGQQQLVTQILRGGDALGIMPTGAGKSICYQVPAMLLPGLTVVISPLISLMQDQVAALREAGIPAACLHSNLDQDGYFETMRAARSGQLKLLYAAPERLMTDAFRSLAAQREISMVAVDEAHCLSQWGQDFRPHYLEIAAFLRQLPRRPVVSAFTATATAAVREDIRRLLELHDPLEIVTGFDRANLRWNVERPTRKYDALLRILRENRGESGIIYCISRRATDELCEKLNADGFRAGRYHAGMSPAERSANQEAFLHDEVQVITATNAFGMGIDKSDVRFVVHYNMPKSMEAYYQEAGRAGRDGMPAVCTLLFSPQDIRTNQFLIDNSDTENEKLTAEEREAVRRMDHARLQSMVRYCALTDCLRGYILRYFGEQAPHFCGNCSSCLSASESVDATVESQKILSCVYRLKQRGRSGGVRLLCDILQGKTTKQITDGGYATLSTYGLMGDTPRRQLEQMVNVLISRDYLQMDTGDYPTLSLTAKAAPVLRGAETVRMALPKQAERKPKREVQVQSLDADFLHRLGQAADGSGEAVFQGLRRVRAKIAAREGVPSYIVFSDATLRDMAKKRPQNADAMLEIDGVGKYKMEKYGAAFLAAIAELSGPA